MMRSLHVLFSSAQAEIIQLLRTPLLVILVMIQSITFIFLVNFFGMTGAFAPTALINNDHGVYANIFIENLQASHHSFTLLFMDEKTAQEAVKHGDIVAIITIPKGFTKGIVEGKTVPVDVVVDNIDTDMTADIQRALPAAITRFGSTLHLPNIHVKTAEVDLIDHDTGFIEYLVVSALALSAFIVSGILSAVAVAHEFESGTIRLWAVSPIHPLIPLLGRIFGTNAIALATMIIAVGIVMFGHGVYPIHPIEMIVALLSCIIIFGCIGATLGVLMKRSLPVAALVFGISLPLYLFSGAYEPERFDGNIIWSIAHFFPIYYAVGVLEHAVLDLRVTPEPVVLNFLALAIWAILSLVITSIVLRKRGGI
jgi:ABC-2 type transport system permease protein